MRKKISVLVCGAMLVAGSAFAGNIPEFDAVGDDTANFFATTNSAQYGAVITNNVGALGPVNADSDFTTVVYETIYGPRPEQDKKIFGEYFKTDAGQLFADYCFGAFSSALTDVWNEGKYHWSIVLQMKPESDLNINIYDCVLKHNEFTPWGSAEQTGRYRAPWGQLFFVPSANPAITVTAVSGPFNTNGPFSFVMDGRTLPGLTKVALDGAVYTSKAIWTEGIVAELPATGTTNMAGLPVYNLHMGDRILVDVTVPGNNSTDIRYGADSVIVKYIGIVGTWVYASQMP